jgi:hypothetical protein
MAGVDASEAMRAKAHVSGAIIYAWLPSGLRQY